jgi:hypothetical protein
VIRLREINWGIIGALIFSLLAWYLLFGAITTAAAQEPATVRDGAQIQRILPGPAVRELWDSVVVCSGELRDTTQTFEEITFLLRDTTWVGVKNEDLLMGEWSADSIFITKGFELDGWVVAHEMLHHALNGPPTGNPHPLTPFKFPCGLYDHP